ncbi:hypothetical protein [Thiorhodococcus fuscus]|uniref:DUF2125 domain-containing protein n=1 Tax=Thiorhodococcus fuscus TaxID=527200 RepID=A0ABW4Y5B1_9GAMM
MISHDARATGAEKRLLGLRPTWQALLWTASGLASILLVGGLVVRFWPLLHPSLSAVATPEMPCDLHAGPCRAVFSDGGRVTFAIEPASIPVMTPLTLDVAIEGVSASEIEVDFVGVDMNMGFNRVSLTPLGEGRYQGRKLLPVCVRASMTWEARVLLHTAQGIMAAPFRFETQKARPPAGG